MSHTTARAPWFVASCMMASMAGPIDQSLYPAPITTSGGNRPRQACSTCNAVDTPARQLGRTSVRHTLASTVGE